MASDDEALVVEIDDARGVALTDRWKGAPTDAALARFTAWVAKKSKIEPRKSRIYDPRSGIVLATWRR